jgi:hypothetical protein
MSISWRSSAAEFERILGSHGVAAGACTMEAAWAAFEEFVQVPVEGGEGPEDDGDGFIVEWGVWDWTGNRPALSLGRLIAVNEDGDRRDPYWQPQYWRWSSRLASPRTLPGRTCTSAVAETVVSITLPSVSRERRRSRLRAASLTRTRS